MARPTVGTESFDKGVEMTIFVPYQCIDEQAYQLTHEQIRHLTGTQLQDAYRRRHRALTITKEISDGTG